MIRRLNFTGRQRIKQEHIAIKLEHDASGSPAFSTALNLEAYELQQEADVFIEAYRHAVRRRFKLGTVADIRASQQPMCSLTGFRDPADVLFLLKVVAVGAQAGKLLAKADSLSAGAGDGFKSSTTNILTVCRMERGNQGWRVDFDTDRPVLLVNSADFVAVAKSHLFRLLVFPAAVRLILLRIGEPPESWKEDEDTWQGQWVRFATGLPGVDEPPREEQGADAWAAWVDEVVEAFAEKHRMKEGFAREITNLTRVSS